MTRKQLRRVVILVVIAYALLGVFGAALRLIAPESDIYNAYKEMVPFIFAIPAALLGYAFQQRGSYLASLRALWSKLVEAVNGAIQYTFDSDTNERQYAAVMSELAIAIDEVRGVYRNVGELPGNVGLYPYEPLKRIYALINGLGYGQLDAVRRRQAREQIIRDWQSIRWGFLSEFDRAEPAMAITEGTLKQPSQQPEKQSVTAEQV
jgi:hypothetical protein